MRIPLDYIGRLGSTPRTPDEQKQVKAMYDRAREFGRESKIDTSLIGKKRK